MSGVLKGIGKVFKAIKKVALPVLAIAAVALTGGAALGVLPALSSTIGSLGLGSTLTGVLVTAAQGATMGALGAAVTGGNVLKGATSGLLTGAALGGVNVALGGATGTAGQAAKTASSAGGAPAAAPGAGISSAASTGSTAASTATQAATMAGNPLASVTANTPFLNAALSAPVAAPAAAGGAAGGVIGGIGKTIGGIFKNPITAGMAIQGVGAGISAASQAAADRRQQDQIRDNYSHFAGTRGVPTITDPGYLAFDPKTGRTYAQGN